MSCELSDMWHGLPQDVAFYIIDEWKPHLFWKVRYNRCMRELIRYNVKEVILTQCVRCGTLLHGRLLREQPNQFSLSWKIFRYNSF